MIWRRDIFLHKALFNFLYSLGDRPYFFLNSREKVEKEPNPALKHAAVIELLALQIKFFAYSRRISVI